MNPFIYTQPVSGKDFCNREEAISHIETYTLSNNFIGNVWITGQRQVGKTSLLQKVLNKHTTEQKIIKRFNNEVKICFVYTNVQDCGNQDKFFMYLYVKLKETFDFKLKPDKDNTANFIQAIEYIYQKTGSFVVFLIDEFDACLRLIAKTNQTYGNQLQDTLSRIMEGNTYGSELIRKCSFVYASNHSLTDLEDLKIIPYGSFSVQEYELKWFSKEQTSNLATEYLINEQLKFTNKEIALCFEATHGYPYFTQKLLAIMYDQKPLYANEKDFRNTIAKKFAEEIEQTIKTWGGPSMPKRTLKGLKEMISQLKFGENLGKAIGTFLSEFVKSFMN